MTHRGRILSSGSGHPGLSLGMLKRLARPRAPTRTASRAAMTSSPRRRKARLPRSSAGNPGARSCRRASKGIAALALSDAIHRVRDGVIRMARTSLSMSPAAHGEGGIRREGGLAGAEQAIEGGDAVERAWRPFARGEPVADLLILLHGLAVARPGGPGSARSGTGPRERPRSRGTRGPPGVRRRPRRPASPPCAGRGRRPAAPWAPIRCAGTAAARA